MGQPSIWRPVAIMHNDLAECQTQMAAKSAANEVKSACVPKKADMNGQKNNNELADLVSKTNKADCEAADVGGVWFTEKFDMPAGYPFCVKAAWSQVNNLGDVEETAKGGLPRNWDWTLPTIDQFAASGCYVYNSAGTGGQKYVRVVTRLRYNMTTMDYAPYATNAACNQNKKGNVQSPVEQNPTVDVGVDMQGLRLALNTAQTGRTFQDRSHVFRVMKMPDAAGAAAMKSANKIINVSVQGKRGNIVQTFPAVEYDFWPKTVEMNIGDCAAFQWTGSNTHNNGNPAGDGQAGDAGEGRGGSDRSNLIQIMDENSTYPAPLDKAVVDDFFANSKVFRTYTGEAVSTGNPIQGTEDPQTLAGRDAQVYFLSAGYYATEDGVAQAVGNDADGELNVLLNNTPASMRGMTVCPEKAGTYEFTCTRNNNFSNRDQKLTIVVTA